MQIVIVFDIEVLYNSAEEVRDMIAEIYKKETKREDQLTGDVFGSLRYLPFDCGMKPVMQNSVYPANLLHCLDNIQLNEWAQTIGFWGDCRYNNTEPDVVIELANTVILIEVKLDSGLGENQLEREAHLLLEKYPHCDKKILVVLGPEVSSADIYEKYRDIIPNTIAFGYITWQKVLTALKNIHLSNPFHALMIEDLSKLLIRKGFESFRGFEKYAFDIDPFGYWEFRANFDFTDYSEIREDLYYEFK